MCMGVHANHIFLALRCLCCACVHAFFLSCLIPKCCAWSTFVLKSELRHVEVGSWVSVFLWEDVCALCGLLKLDPFEALA